MHENWKYQSFISKGESGIIYYLKKSKYNKSFDGVDLGFLMHIYISNEGFSGIDDILRAFHKILGLS